MVASIRPHDLQVNVPPAGPTHDFTSPFEPIDLEREHAATNHSIIRTWSLMSDRGFAARARRFTEHHASVNRRGTARPFIPAHRTRTVLAIAARAAIVLAGVVIAAALLPWSK